MTLEEQIKLAAVEVAEARRNVKIACEEYDAALEARDKAIEKRNQLERHFDNLIEQLIGEKSF